MAAGVPHSVRNASDEAARIVNLHQPAQRFESFFRDIHRLIHEGKIRRLPPKGPRSAIYAAMLFGNYPDEIRAVKPPTPVFQALALVRERSASGSRCDGCARAGERSTTHTALAVASRARREAGLAQRRLCFRGVVAPADCSSPT